MAEIKEQVEQALGDIRPALQADGGDIELVDGYANLTFERHRATDAWKIVRWRDESNF